MQVNVLLGLLVLVAFIAFNEFAELIAILKGLEMACCEGCRNVVVQSNSFIST